MQNELKRDALDWFYSIERTYRETAKANGEDSIFHCRADYAKLAIDSIEISRQPDPKLAEIVEAVENEIGKMHTVMEETESNDNLVRHEKRRIYDAAQLKATTANKLLTKIKNIVEREE